MSLVTRLARLEDKKGILDINPDNLDGMDYVDYILEHFIIHKDYYPMVGELNGKIVAFGYMHVVDGGQIINRGGRRVMEKHRGNGFMSEIEFGSSDIAKKDHPQIQTDLIYYCALGSDFHLKEICTNPIRKLLLQQHLICYKERVESLESLISGDKFNTLLHTHKGHEEVILVPKGGALVESLDASKERLFPNGYLRVFKEPYRPLKSNFEYIVETCDSLVSYSPHHHGDVRMIDAVTFLTVFKVPAGVRVEIDFYGINKEDLLVEHFLKSVPYVTKECRKQNFRGFVHFCVYYQMEIKRNVIEQLIAEKFKWEPGAWFEYKFQFVAAKLKEKPAEL